MREDAALVGGGYNTTIITWLKVKGSNPENKKTFLRNMLCSVAEMARELLIISMVRTSEKRRRK